MDTKLADGIAYYRDYQWYARIHGLEFKIVGGYSYHNNLGIGIGFDNNKSQDINCVFEIVNKNYVRFVAFK